MSTVPSDNETTEQSMRVRKLLSLLGEDEALDNFVGDNMEKWSLASKARSPACHDGKDMLGLVVPLKHWMQHVVQFNDPNLGPVEVVRTVLISASGDFYQFTSDGVFDSLRLLLQYMGQGPWENPIPVTLCMMEKNNRTFYYLEQPPRAIEKPDQVK